MDESAYRIRAATEADYDARSRITSRLHPEFPATAQELRQLDQTFREPHLVKIDLMVEEHSSGTAVAHGALHHVSDAYDPHRFWIGVEVDPDHQHRQIGRALYERLEGLARERSVEALWTSVLDQDARSVRFFERAGFVVRRQRWMSRLDLASVPPGALAGGHVRPDSGVVFTTLSQEGADRRDVQEKVYRLDLEASRDEPRLEPMTEISFEEYSVMAFDGPRFFPEAVFLARVGDEYVAISTLHRLSAEADTLLVGFTGTLRAYRGRGLASELKRRTVEFARGRGYRYLRTFNDSKNPTMWAINQKLGFQVQQQWSVGEKKF
jgi:GNAT superfamily N-acetyltransferase